MIVAGIGGAGCSAVNHMLKQGVPGVAFVVMNTDEQALAHSPCPAKVMLDRQDPAASRGAIAAGLHGVRLAVLVAGLGGQTGTAALPAVARICGQLGIPPLCLVTTPLAFEGKRRADRAAEGLEALLRVVGAACVLPTEAIKAAADQNSTVGDFFDSADERLLQGVRAIAKQAGCAAAPIDPVGLLRGLQEEGFTLCGYNGK